MAENSNITFTGDGEIWGTQVLGSEMTSFFHFDQITDQTTLIESSSRKVKPSKFDIPLTALWWKEVRTCIVYYNERVS